MNVVENGDLYVLKNNFLTFVSTNFIIIINEEKKDSIGIVYEHIHFIMDFINLVYVWDKEEKDLVFSKIKVNFIN